MIRQGRQHRRQLLAHPERAVLPVHDAVGVGVSRDAGPALEPNARLKVLEAVVVIPVIDGGTLDAGDGGDLDRERVIVKVVVRGSDSLSGIYKTPGRIPSAV